MKNGASLKVFAEKEVACGQTCTEATVSCSQGTLSGSTQYTEPSCSPKICKCKTVWGALIDQDQTVDAYKLNQMNCATDVKCTDAGNKIKLKCTDVTKNQLSIVEGTGNVNDFKYSTCSMASCGCVHLGVFFKPSDPPLKVYKIDSAKAPQKCEAVGSFGTVTCKQITSNYFQVQGDTNTSIYKFTQCKDENDGKGDGTGMSDSNVGPGAGGGLGGGLGNDVGDGEGFRRRRKGGGGGGGSGCDITQPPYYCSANVYATFTTDSSMCFLPTKNGYEPIVPKSDLDIRQRITPGGVIPAYSVKSVQCGDSCSKYLGLVRCDQGLMSGKTKFIYTDCVENCP